MNVEYSSDLGQLPIDTLVVIPYFEGDDMTDVQDVLHLQGPAWQRAVSRGEVQAKLYSQAHLQPTDTLPGLLIIGAGKREDVTPRLVSRVAATGSRYATGRGYTSIAVLDRHATSAFDFGHAATEGAILGSYDERLLKTHQEIKRDLQNLRLVSDGQNDVEGGARLGQIVGESKCLARNLVNLPPNEVTPTSLAVRASDLANKHGLEFHVLDQDAMRDHGMGCLLGVAAGSDQPPRLIVLRYGEKTAPARLALIGKGLTFDSGGLSLKTADGMETMKSDMSGAAAVIGCMVAVARLGLKNVSVAGYVGATENMPGGGAMRPGDVLTAMNGETVEVLNTDAEGRLVLADVLAYAVSQGATHMVDFATLTGAAVVALGYAATMAAGKPESWVRKVVAAADHGLERAWGMPLYEEYRRAMDSDLADIKNTGGRPGGALTATAFLSDFVGDAAWTHMDIAGTAFLTTAEPYGPKGATGEGVGTALALARSLATTA